MLVIKAFVNYGQIDEIHIHNIRHVKNGIYEYEIVKPEGVYSTIKHKRSDGWKVLTELVLHEINKK